jgi:hypothetical protein
MYGPTWDVAPLSTPTWSFNCRDRWSDAWSVGFIVRRNWGEGNEEWGYSKDFHAPSPFTMSGFPYTPEGNGGHIPTGYIMVTNWSVDRNNYTNIAVCDMRHAKAIDASAAAAGTVTGKEENGGLFAYSTRVETEHERDGTRHLFVTHPLRPNGVTDARLSCPAGSKILRAFAHVGYYTSQALIDHAEATQLLHESRTTLEAHVSLHDRPGETDVVALAKDKRAILYEDIYCGRG